MLTGGDPRVVVDGVDLYEEFGVYYTDESERKPPEKRTNYLTIPGMDGDLDLSEMLADDINFGPREETMVFYVPGDQDFERAKTRLSNFLDGKRLDYSYSFDPGYTLTGRFRVVDYSGWRLHRIEVEVDADPWKRGEPKHYVVDAAGGTLVTVENARRRVSPVFTVNKPSLIEYGGRAWELPEAGKWQPDLRLREGRSQIYVNSAPMMCDTTWEDLARLYPRWEDIPKGTRWSDVFVTKEDRPKGRAFRITIDYYLYDL